MDDEHKPFLARLVAPFMDIFGLSRLVALTAVLFIGGALVLAIFWFWHSAPPDTMTITSGAEGSTYQTSAEKYRAILARNGVTLKILPSEGSEENLRRLTDPSFHVNVGFVQGGVTNGAGSEQLVSLGSISYEPLLVFYRGNAAVTRLSQLSGQRLAIGPPGSGTRSLTLTLLETNGIAPGGATVMVDLDAAAAAKALIGGEVDAAFMMGDSASTQIMRELLHAPGVRLLDFVQAEAYTRRIAYLNKLELPEGSIDLGKNIPANDVNLIGPTIELLARPGLHPALCDLLLEAAQEVHGGASLLKRKGEFPAPLVHDFPISADASLYYKSGKSFFYRHLPFRLASLVSPFLVAFVPVFVLLIPTLRIIPTLFRLRVRLILYRWYRTLLVFERDLRGDLAPEKRQELLARLDRIEQEVNKMKVSAPFADQFYGLREHIAFVRSRIVDTTPSS